MSTFNISPCMHLRKGVPDPDYLKTRLLRYGFQNILLQGDSLGSLKENPSKPQEDGQHFLLSLPQKEMGLSHQVVCQRQYLGIPQNEAEAEDMLKILSGRRHQIWSTFGVHNSNRLYYRTLLTRINFKRLHPQEIKSYVQSQEWQGQIGGYKWGGEATPFIKAINGSPSALRGLPEYEFSNFMQRWMLNFAPS